jgi:hypothetical protein
MADESIQNGTNGGGDVPEIELIIKVSVRKYCPFVWALLYEDFVASRNGWARKMAE